MASFQIRDIIAIKEGNKTLYKGSYFSKNPSYTADFTYCGHSHRTVLNCGGSQYVNVDPVYRIIINSQNDGQKMVVDCYRLVKEFMRGKSLTSKKRKDFEREFLKIVDRADSINVAGMIEKAVENARIWIIAWKKYVKVLLSKKPNDDISFGF